MEVLGYVVLLFLLAFLAGAGAGVGASSIQRPARPARIRIRRGPPVRAGAPDPRAHMGHDRAMP